MLTAIQFHNQTCILTNKIDNEATNRLLPAELVPFQLPAAQLLPKTSLSVRRVSPKLSGAIDGMHSSL